MAASKLTVGDRAPDFVLPDATGTGREFYNEIRGLPIVLVFHQKSADRSDVRDLMQLGDTLDAVGGAQIFGVFVGDEASLAKAARRSSGGPVLLADVKGKITEAYGAMLSRSGRFALVLDPNQRVVAVPDGAAPLDGVAAAVEALSAPSPRQVTSVAPVLMVPRLIEPALCRRLIETWRTGKRSEGVVMAIENGNTTQAVSTGTKRRTDHYIEDAGLKAALTRTIGPRLATELGRTFFFDRFRFQPFRIGCYSEKDRGFFKRHRDFIDKAYEARRYAVSLNLNAGDYEGGDLCFPEYGPETYQPQTGGAVVFSGMLMHEVLPVTAGERFVLLTFLEAVEPK